MEKGLAKREFWDHGGTLNEIESTSGIPERDVIESVNFRVHPDNKTRIKRPGCDKHGSYDFGGEAIRGIFDFEDTDGNIREVVVTDKKIFVSTPAGGWTEVYSQATALDRAVKLVAFESGRPIIVGFNENLTIYPTVAYKLGIDAPTTALTAVDSGVAGNPNGEIKYVVTFYKSGNYPCESNPSPESTAVTVVTNKVDLSNIPISSDPKVNRRRLYKTKADGAILYWMHDIEDNTTTTYQEDYSDDDISGSDEVRYDRYPPPKADDIEVWDNRIWLTVNSENLLYFTNTSECEEMSIYNFIPIKAREPDNLNGIKAFGDSLYVFKKHNRMFRVDKIGDYYYELTQLPFNTGCDAPVSIAISDDLMIWKSKHGIEIFNGDKILRPMLSRFVKKTLKSIANDCLDKAFGELNGEESEYWLSVPTGSSEEPNEVIVLNYITGAFYGQYKFHKNMTAFYNTAGLSFLSGSSDGNFYMHNVGYSDDGEVITANFKKPWIAIGGEQEIYNKLRRLFVRYILAGNYNLVLNIYLNFKKNPIMRVSLPGITIDDVPEIRNEIMRRIDTGISGTHICFEFSNNEVLEGECRVIGYDAYFDKKTWKKDVTGE